MGRVGFKDSGFRGRDQALGFRDCGFGFKDLEFRDITPNNGESNGKEHGKSDGNWDLIGVYRWMQNPHDPNYRIPWDLSQYIAYQGHAGYLK